MNNDAEKAFSLKKSIRDNPALLISPHLLRTYGCSQIDSGVVRGDQIYLFEVKTSLRFSNRQISRLKKSCFLISRIANLKTSLIFYCHSKNIFFRP